MSTESITRAARLLTETRRAITVIDGLGDDTPHDLVTAEAIATEHAAMLGHDVIGWKIGATSAAAMELLGSPGAFAGRIFDGTNHGSGVIEADAIIDPKLECEFAFVTAYDVEPATGWTGDTAKATAAAVAPAFEIVGPRFADMFTVGWLSLVADSGANAGIRLGEAVPVDQLPDLSSLEVSLSVDGEPAASGTGEAIMGDPWAALAWMLEHHGERGLTMPAGSIIMSGTCTGVTPLAAGSSATADYGPLGTLSISRTSG